MIEQNELRIFAAHAPSKDYMHVRQELLDAGAIVLSATSKHPPDEPQQPILYAATGRIDLKA